MSLLVKLIYFVFILVNIYLRVLLPLAVVVVVYFLWKRLSPFARDSAER